MCKFIKPLSGNQRVSCCLDRTGRGWLSSAVASTSCFVFWEDSENGWLTKEQPDSSGKSAAPALCIVTIGIPPIIFIEQQKSSDSKSLHAENQRTLWWNHVRISSTMYGVLMSWGAALCRSLPYPRRFQFQVMDGRFTKHVSKHAKASAMKRPAVSLCLN